MSWVDNEERVQAEMVKLAACKGDYRLFHEQLDRERQAWWESHKDSLNLTGSLLRQAHALILLEYLQLRPEDVPIVYEDERKIVWRSFDPCPTLQACQRMGLDTRQVCKIGTEESVERLIKHLDPRLRFSRNYAEGFRPYQNYCEEVVELVD